MDLELCCNNYESALLADEFGFKRLELCANLAAGGITPSAGTIAKVIQNIGAECHVLIRPRVGDFNYSDDEIEIMVEDIRFCKTIGCVGVVFGVMNEHNSFDLEKNLLLLEAAEGMETTFHRAIDVSADLEKDIESIINCGFDRILTSGGQASAEQGLEQLKLMRKITEDKIDLMIGGGIKSSNIFKIQHQISPDAIHFSASESNTSGFRTLFEAKVIRSSRKTIQSILDVLED